MGRTRSNGRTPKRDVDLTDLERYRRERDMSYQELTTSIFSVTGHKRNQDCWRKICLGITHEPQATTKDILVRFLEKVAS